MWYKNRWFILSIEILLAIFIFFAIQWYNKLGVVTGEVPEIEAKWVSGKPFLQEQYAGKPLLIHFWASWCPVCRFEEDNIQQLYIDSLKQSGRYHVITVAMQSGNAMEVMDYLQKNNLSFPTLVDEYGELARKFGVKGVPSSFIIDKHGQVRFTEVGFTSEIGLRTRLWWVTD